MSEMNCMKCRVDDFKNSLCEGDFCKMYHGEGDGIDFINAVKASACPTAHVDDLISRKAAMDAFDCTNELIIGGEANARNVENYLNKVLGKIKDLPSAQPEVIRCKDCIWFDRYTDGIEKYQWDGFCAGWARTSYENWYCSMAERRTDGSD